MNLETIKELRNLTQAGMNDCKLALQEANGNLERAIDIIKAKGLQNAASRQNNIASEGIVVISDVVRVNNENKVVIVECNSQTDFVSKSPDFVSFAKSVVNSILLHDKISDTLLTLQKDLIAKFKENIVVRNFKNIIGEHLHTYLHSNNKLGVIVKFDTHVDSVVADSVAMQIAAMNPLAITPEQLSKKDVDRQKEIIKLQIKEDLKTKNKTVTEEILEKMMTGKLNKWFAEVCLVKQVCLTDPNITIEKLLHGVNVVSFERVLVGEGIEKTNTSSFSEEVSKMIN